jgi:HSP90 family molecular chaperone
LDCVNIYPEHFCYVWFVNPPVWVCTSDHVDNHCIQQLDDVETSGASSMTDIEQHKEELRKLIREANEAKADLKALTKEVQEIVSTQMGEIVTNELKRQLNEMGVATRIAMDQAVKKVNDEFAKLERLFLGKENDGNPTLESLIKNYKA